MQRSHATWQAAEAKRRFSALMGAAQAEPQVVEVRGKPVGVMVGYEAFCEAPELRGERSLAQWLEELGALPDDDTSDSWTGEIGERADRRDQFGPDWS